MLSLVVQVGRSKSGSNCGVLNPYAIVEGILGKGKDGQMLWKRVSI